MIILHKQDGGINIVITPNPHLLQLKRKIFHRRNRFHKLRGHAKTFRGQAARQSIYSGLRLRLWT